MPNTENAKNVTLQTVIKLRRAAFADDCVLALGEPGYHTTTKEFKIGDGTTTWKNLPFANKTQIEALIAAGVQEAKDYADSKVVNVTKEDGTAITVDNSNPKNPKVGLDLNNTGNVILSQTDAGLSANIDLSAYKTDAENGEKYKQLQEAITATETATNVFVYGVAQDKNGEISVETKAVDFSDYYTKDETDGKVHDHVDGTGTVVSGSAAGGDVAINLNLEFAKLGEDKKLKLVDKTSKAVVAEFEASEFIKDGMLHDVSYDAGTNKLTFTWNTDAGEKTDEVTLTDILDPYEFIEGNKIDITIDGTKVTIAHEVVAEPTASAGTGRTYLTGVTTDGYGHIIGYTTNTETDQDLSGYKVIQESVEDEDAAVVEADTCKETFSYVKSITQNEQGVITVTKEEMKMPALTLNDDRYYPEGNGDVVVDLDCAGDYSSYSITHKTYQTGTVKDTTRDSATDPSFITGIEINNGHVTGATVQNLATVLENMIFVLDGGESASTLFIN